MKKATILGAVLIFALSCSQKNTIPTFENLPALEGDTVRVMDEEFSLPFHLIKIEPYWDGGIYCFELHDLKGEKLYFCEDQRIDSKTKGRFYLNGYPGDDSRLVISERNVKLLVSILKDAVDRYMSADELAEMSKKKFVDYTDKEHDYLAVTEYLKSRVFLYAPEKKQPTPEREPVTVASLKEKGILPAWFGEVDKLPIPQENIVVYEGEKKAFIPTDEEVEVVHSAVLRVLNDFVAQQVKKIKSASDIRERGYWYLIKNLEDYWVQIRGKIDNGERVLFCAFYHSSFANEPDQFRTMLKEKGGVLVLGGGEQVWKVDINLKGKKVTDGRFNADK